MPQRGARLRRAVTHGVERLRRRLPRRRVQHVLERLRCPVQRVAVLVTVPGVEQHALDLHQLGKYGVAVLRDQPPPVCREIRSRQNSSAVFGK
jgi:hypothetical protein